MQQTGREAFLGWLRTTWFPYTDRLPVELGGAFLGGEGGLPTERWSWLSGRSVS